MHCEELKGTVQILFAEDGKQIKAVVCTSCKSETIREVSINTIDSESPVDGYSIIVIVITQQMLDTMKSTCRVATDSKWSWLNQADRTIVMYTDEAILDSFEQCISQLVNIAEWKKVRKFNTTNKRDWLYAEAEMTYLLEDTKNTLLSEGSNNIVFKPDTVSGLVSVIS